MFSRILVKKLTQWAREHRRNRTPAEDCLRNLLLKAGIRFRTERPIGKVIVDFLIFDRWLVVEVDGGYHSTEKQKLKDAAKTEFLQSKGYRVLRFTNETVFQSGALVINSIRSVPKKPPPANYRKLFGVAAY